MSRIPEQNYRCFSKRRPKENRYSNYCLAFNPALLQYVNCGDANVVDGLDSFTFEIWMRSRNAALQQGLINKWATGIGNREYLWELNGGVQRFAGEYSGAYVDHFGTITLLSNQFYCLGVTWNGATLSFYTNGAFNVSFAVADVGAFPNAFDLIVGAVDPDDVNPLLWRFFDGWLNEARILNRALTAYEMQESCARGYARLEPGVVFLLRMEEGAGPTAFDTSGAGNNGNLLPALTPPVWTRVAKYELLAEAGI